MAIYSLALNSTVATTGAAAGDVRNATLDASIMEAGIQLGAATASTYGLGRSANTPVQTSGVAVLAEDVDRPAGISTMAVAWSTAPTVPANFFRRASLPATIGAGMIWTFPRGLVLGAGAASMLVWNLATNSASLNFWFVMDE